MYTLTVSSEAYAAASAEPWVSFSNLSCLYIVANELARKYLSLRPIAAPAELN